MKHIALVVKCLCYSSLHTEIKSRSSWDSDTQVPCKLHNKDHVTKSITGMYVCMYLSEVSRCK